MFMRLIVSLILLCSASFSSAASSTIGILVFEGFLTSDVTAPVEVFGAATKKSWFSSYDVVLISASKEKKVTSEEGLKVVADYSIYDDIPLDVLLVPSAYDMEPFIHNKALIQYIKKQKESASWLGSNCSGSSLLGEAGILDGKKATTWFGGERGLEKSYPKVNVQYDQNVVLDEKVITSNGGAVSYQAALELLAKLSSDKFANEIAVSIQLDRLSNHYGGKSNK